VLSLLNKYHIERSLVHVPDFPIPIDMCKDFFMMPGNNIISAFYDKTSITCKMLKVEKGHISLG